MIYTLLFIGMIGLRYVLSPATRTNRLAYRWLLVALFFFSAFRFEVGPDWAGYLNIFQIQRWSSYIEASARSEPGYWLLNELVHNLGWPYPMVNVFSSLVFFVGLHAMARRQPDPLGFLVLTFPILIINMPMSAVRQAMSIGMMCFAFNAFNDKKQIRFVLSVIIGASFHSSALVFLLLTPLVTGDYTRRRLFATAMLAMPGIAVLANTSGSEIMYRRYLETEIEAVGAIFRLAILLVTGIYFHRNLKVVWQRLYSADLKLVSIGSMMMLACFPPVFVSTVIADRFGYYLIPIQAAILSRIPYLLREDQHRNLFSAAPYLGLLFVFIVWTQNSWLFAEGYLPYQNWLFGFPNSRYP